MTSLANIFWYILLFFHIMLQMFVLDVQFISYKTYVTKYIHNIICKKNNP